MPLGPHRATAPAFPRPHRVRITRRAGIAKHASPHTLRHAFITAASFDAGVPLRDVQEAASHADPRTTMRYDRTRTSLDRHATYIVAVFIAGAARPSRSAWPFPAAGRPRAGSTVTEITCHSRQRDREPQFGTAAEIPGPVC